MKTPSPQEAAKMTNRQIASEIATDCVNAIGAMALPIALKREPEAFDLCGKIERALDAKDAALLEADKNGYERGRKEHFQCQRWMQVAEHQARQDEAMLRECYEGLSDMSGFFLTNRANDLHDKLKARLAPSDSGGEKK